MRRTAGAHLRQTLGQRQDREHQEQQLEHRPLVGAENLHNSEKTWLLTENDTEITHASVEILAERETTSALRKVKQ